MMLFDVFGQLAFIVKVVALNPIMPEFGIEVRPLSLAFGWHIICMVILGLHFREDPESLIPRIPLRFSA